MPLICFASGYTAAVLSADVDDSGLTIRFVGGAEIHLPGMSPNDLAIVHAATAPKFVEVPPEATCNCPDPLPGHHDSNRESEQKAYRQRICEHEYHDFGTRSDGSRDIGCQLCGATKPT